MMLKIYSQIMQMGFIGLYGFVLLDEKESAIKSIDFLMQLTRYMEKPEGEKVLLDEELKNVQHIIKLRKLKSSQAISLNMIEKPLKNIYIRRFSVFMPLASYILNTSTLEDLTLDYELRITTLFLTLKKNNEAIKTIKIETM